MKYYAVTEDPRELMHYGIKGMKWGILRTDAQLGHPKTTSSRRSTAKTKTTKARSEAYQRAKEKLSAGMRKGIQKAKDSIREYRSPAAKAERSFQKHLQLARQGRLKYKGISDDEVYRIADRLALERSSRQLSGTEPQSYLRRLRTAAQEGTIRGVEQGTSSYIDARMRGRGQTTAKIKEEKRLARFHDSWQGRRAAEHEARAKDRAARMEAQLAVDKEYYKQRAEDGLPLLSREEEQERQDFRNVGNVARVGYRAAKYAINTKRSGNKLSFRDAKAATDYKNLDWSGNNAKRRAQYLAAAKQRSAEEEQLQKLNAIRDTQIATHFGKKYAENLYGPLSSGNNQKKGSSTSSAPSSTQPSSSSESGRATHAVRRRLRPRRGRR